MSCSKDGDLDIKEPDISPDAIFSLAVESVVKTKATPVANPKDRIRKLSVIIYVGDEFYTMKDSVLPADKIDIPEYTINEVVNIPVKSGNAKVLILANAENSGEFAGKSLEAALALKTKGLQGEIHSRLTMSSDVMDVTLGASVHNYLGYAKGNTDGIKVISSTPVSLYRNVARIQLSKLTLQEQTDFGDAVSFKLKKIYIANAKSHSYPASKTKTTGNVDNQDWGAVEVAAENTAGFWWAGIKGDKAGEFDKLTYDYTEVNDRLCYNFDNTDKKWGSFAYYDENTSKDPEKEVLLNVGTLAYTNIQDECLVFPIGNFFYTYENQVLEEGAKTIFVLCGDYTYIPTGGKKEITNEDTFYSVIINETGTGNTVTGVANHKGVKRNTKYSLELTIKGPGSPTPDPSERAYIGAKIKVNSWNVVEMDSKVD